VANKTYPVRRAVIELPGVPRFEQTVASERDVRDLLEHVRASLRAAVASGKCASLVLTVHQHGEGCDHE